MEEVDKGCPVIRMGVSGEWMSFLLVPAYPGSPGPTAIKLLCVYIYCIVCSNLCN